MTERWRSISLTAFDVLWEHVFGPDRDKPYVLDCESPGETSLRRRDAEARAWAELKHTDAPDRWLLWTLAEPDESFSLRWDSAEPMRVLAARRGDMHALAAIARRDTNPPEHVVWFRWGTEGRLPVELVSFLALRQPTNRLRAPHHIRLESLARAGAQVRSRLADAGNHPVTFLRDQLIGYGESVSASTAFARLGAATSAGRGEFTVAVGHGRGRRTTDHKVIVDLTGGSWSLVVTKDEYVTMKDATVDTVVDELYSELFDLTGRRVHRSRGMR